MSFPDEPPHIEGRAEFNRAASCAGPTLDTDVKLIIFDKSFRVDFHKKISNVKVQISKESQISNGKIFK
jgi:hypothetical protein